MQFDIWKIMNVNKINIFRVKETTKLLDAAGKFLVANEYPHLRKPLKIMDKTNLADCQFLIKVEGLPANRPRLDFFLTIMRIDKGFYYNILLL